MDERERQAARTATGDRASGAGGDGGKGRVVTIFRSRLRPESREAYESVAAEMERLARTMPGLVEVKSFAADDGERVTIVVFDSLEHQRAWRDHPEHRRAQLAGQRRFYSEYDISVCEVLRRRRFEAAPGPDA
ncbi:MAG TPA: antibiotic biosynthesis monooxygenase [Acidimicrobiales bacterium]|nr:antibiotic biosynthesis monooxygenase [Acidimicrobiales bacterium]